jgi:hypothetical protein
VTIYDSPMPETSEVRWPALDEVLGSLGGEVIGAVHGPTGPSRAVSDVLFYDATDAHSVRADAIVLALGVNAGSALGLVDEAARNGAAAVVLRGDDHPLDRILELARTGDVAVVEASPEVSWGRLYSLLRTALVGAGAAGRAEAAGVPVGDLFAFADATAAAVGGAVTIEDPQWRVLAYSNLGQPIDEPRRDTILGRVPPIRWQQRIEETGAGRALRFGEGVVRHDTEGLAPRLAAAVRVGSELLGSIWVAEGDVPLGADAEEELLRAAQRATVHLISHRASEDIRRRMRGSFVREVLEGRLTTRAARDLRPVTGPFTVLAFESALGQPDADLMPTERVLSILSLYCEDAHPEAMCAYFEHRFWAVVPLPGGRERERSIALARKIVTAVESLTPIRLAAGIGVAVERVADIPRSRRAAERALAVLEGLDDDRRVVHIADVRSRAVLLDLMELATERAELREGTLQQVLADEPERADEHRATLRAYLDCSGNVAAAAKRLGVHPNTLRYRVRRLVERTGLDLDDPDERLVTELQLRMPGAS